jgi:hypothetical protein
MNANDDEAVVTDTPRMTADPSVAAIVDALPEDLDVTAYVGPYVFPSMRRRRIAALSYVVIGGAAIFGGISAALPGVLSVGIGLLAIAGYHWITSWPLRVDQTDALVHATKAIGFPVGHASAQLAWRGWLSRPTWRVLVYSNDEPPTRRGLVELDGVDGTALGAYSEENPEDWSAFGDTSGSSGPS